MAAPVEPEEKKQAAESQRSELISKELLSDEEILKQGIAPSQLNTYRLQKFKEAFTLDKWIHIEALKSLTFDTRFIAVTAKQAKSFLMYCRHIQLEMSKSSGSSRLSQQYTENKAEIDSDVQQLQQAIDTSVTDANWSNGFFAKFNSRSPKDAFGYDGQNEIVKKAFHAALDETKQENGNQFATVNDALIAWYVATAKLLRMQSGKDVIDIFARSFRSLEDLQGTLRLGEEHMDISIAVRKWNDYVPVCPHGEFRCFVHNKQLNAITQYLSNMYFKSLVENKQRIKQRILQFYEEKVKQHVPMDSFVIDFLVLDEGLHDEDNEDGIFVIEFNPFYKSAGAGLFDWKTDRELFLNGPCEMRVREELDPLGLDYMHATWVKSFEEYQNAEKQQLQQQQPQDGDDCCVVL